MSTSTSFKKYSLLRFCFELTRCSKCSALFDAEAEGFVCKESDETRCEACDNEYYKEIEVEFGWIKPYVRDVMWAEREGDFALAKAITESCGVRYDRVY